MELLNLSDRYYNCSLHISLIPGSIILYGHKESERSQKETYIQILHGHTESERCLPNRLLKVFS